METIRNKITAGKRISAEDGLKILESEEFHILGYLANLVKQKKRPENMVTYIVDRNINYTNICISACRFCAFFRPPGHPEGYIIEEALLHEKIAKTISAGGTRILLQGGMNPDLSLQYYMNMLASIKKAFPEIHVHGFSPPEIVFLAKKEDRKIGEVIQSLVDSGLDSIPGGGAEILDDRIRNHISPNKCGSEEWLDVMRTAHQMGLRTTATMMFGHGEHFSHIINHLNKLRNLQDETNGFLSFIPWPFQPNNTRMKQITPATAVEYLRILALSRIFLDNFDNIEVSWVTQGAKTAQIGLFYGANDFGSTMFEENVVAAAGVHFRLSEQEIVRLITDAGFQAIRRNCFFEVLP